jgi:hypothetical protein
MERKDGPMLATKWKQLPLGVEYDVLWTESMPQFGVVTLQAAGKARARRNIFFRFIRCRNQGRRSGPASYMQEQRHGRNWRVFTGFKGGREQSAIDRSGGAT